MRPGDELKLPWGEGGSEVTYRARYLGPALHGHIRVEWLEGPLASREARVPRPRGVR